MPIDTLFNTIVDAFSENRIIGWCPIEKAMDLAATVVALRPKIVCEIGIYGGKSFLPMALACEAIGAGMCHAIDPWSQQESTVGYEGKNAEWWSHLDHEGVRASFYANMTLLGVKDRVVVHRMKSDDAPVPDVIDVISVDGQHTAQAIKDVNRFCSHVRTGGICVMDDLSWTNSGVPHVAQAVDALLKLGFVELYRRKQKDGEWGVYQRVSMSAPAIESPKQIRVTTPTKKAKCRR